MHNFYKTNIYDGHAFLRIVIHYGIINNINNVPPMRPLEDDVGHLNAETTHTLKMILLLLPVVIAF